MFEWLSDPSLSPELRGLGTIAFFLVAVGYSIWQMSRGKKEGPPKPVAEFAFGGALADMGPVKELVEQTGLLVQQQIRTNVALEQAVTNNARIAESMARVAVAVESHLAEQRQEREIQEEVERRVKDRLHP